MSVDEFLRHLADPSPRFVCETAGLEPDERRLEVALEHVLGDGATPGAIEALRSLVGRDCPALEALYHAHDGLQLYVQGETAGLQLFAIGEWTAVTAEFRREFAAWGRTDAADATVRRQPER